MRRPRVSRPLVPLLDLFRLFVGASVLAFAAWTDWRWRRAPPVLWTIAASAGLAALAVDAWRDPSAWPAKWPYLLGLPVLLLLVSGSARLDALAGVLGLGGAALAFALRDAVTPMWPWLVAIPVFVLLIYLLYTFGLIAGGADAKALIAIAVLAPFPVALAPGLPVLASPLPASFAVLGNSLLAFLVVPLGFAVWNLARGQARFPHLFLGTTRRAAEVDPGRVWPMEVPRDDGTMRTRWFASRMTPDEIEAAHERLRALGERRVWVSPKVPFMLPLLAGYVAAFAAGDLLLGLMQRALP